jgi:hypothetical protein
MPDASERLFNKLRSSVYAAQVGKVHKLKGRYVERDGVTFLVVSVDWRGGKVVVSDTKTPLKQRTTFSIKSFLSKSVTVLDEVEDV